MRHGTIAALRRLPRGPLGALVLAALIVIVIGLSGLGGIFRPDSITPTRAMLIVRWMHDRGAVLVLRPDGTFAGAHLPSRFGDWSIGDVPVVGTGEWHIGQFSADPGRCHPAARSGAPRCLTCPADLRATH